MGQKDPPYWGKANDMKYRVKRAELWQGIDTVLDAVPAKPALPMLANLLLVAEEESLSLTATDLDLSIRTQIPAAVQRRGRVAVPARTLAEIVREWPEGELAIEVNDERLVLSGSLGDENRGHGAYALPGMSADDFPPMPTSLTGLSVDWKAVEGFDAKGLIEMINKTAFAVSRDDTRPILNGVFWKLTGQGIEMVATDGHRLAHHRRRLDLSRQIPGEGTEAIVPPQALNQVVKLLNSGVGRRELQRITIGDSQVLFDLGDTQLLSRRIEGPFVDYQQVIPRDNDRQLRLASDHLLPAVRRVSILASSYTHQIRLKLGKNQLELTATSPEIGGEAREVLPAVYHQEEMEVGYNANYLMEILRKMNAPEVVFELKNSLTAAVLRPGELAEGEEYYCLLMPLRPTG